MRPRLTRLLANNWLVVVWGLALSTTLMKTARLVSNRQISFFVAEGVVESCARRQLPSLLGVIEKIKIPMNPPRNYSLSREELL